MLQTPQQQSSSSRQRIIACIVTSVRMLVVIGIPIAAGVACWMMWPQYESRFNESQLAGKLVVPLSYGMRDAIPARRCLQPSQTNDALRDRIKVPHWLAADLDPELFFSDELEKGELSANIVGIELDGNHFAFAVAGMANPYYGTVTVTSSHRQATVTHCPAKDLTRVFVSERAVDAPQLALAGVEEGGEFMLAVDGKCVPQNAVDFPMQELEHRVMTMGEWLQRYPSSKCYLGGLRMVYVDRNVANEIEQSEK